MSSRAALAVAALALSAGCHRDAPPAPPVDAGATRATHPDAAATHVCYGASNSAVEVPAAVRCETLGGSEMPPAALAPATPR